MGWILTYQEAIVLAAAFLGVALWMTFGDLGASLKDGLVLAARELRRKD